MFKKIFIQDGKVYLETDEQIHVQKEDSEIFVADIHNACTVEGEIVNLTLKLKVQDLENVINFNYADDVEESTKAIVRQLSTRLIKGIEGWIENEINNQAA